MATQGRKKFTLKQLIDSLPSDMTYEDFYELVKDKQEFTQTEFNAIVRLVEKRPEVPVKVVKASPVIAIEVEAISPTLEPEEPPQPAYVKLTGVVVCRGLFERSSCHAPIANKGVNGSGFCEACWYPSIVEDYDAYQGHRDEGYPRNVAAVMAGILQEPEQKRVVTYAVKDARKERSDTFSL